MISTRRWTHGALDTWDTLMNPEVGRPEWMSTGNCAGMDPAVFFPEVGDNVGVREAKAVCEGCPALQQCRDWADQHGEKFGIWGGENSLDRRKRRSKKP